MIILLPVFFLVAVSTLIIIINGIKKRFGLAWLIAALSVFIVWGLLLGSRFLDFEGELASGWLPASPTLRVRFYMDSIAWNYGFALTALLAAVILSAPVRYKIISSTWGLAGNMLFAAAGLTAVMAGTPLTLAICWGVIDIIEAIVILRTASGPEIRKQTTLAFAARVTGTYFFVWAIVGSPAVGSAADFSRIQPEMGIYLLLAAGLRMGIIPLRLPYIHLSLSRGLGTMIQMVGLVSSFVLLSRLPPLLISYEWTLILLGFSVLAAVYGGWMWLTAPDEIQGRPFLLAAISGFVMACVVRGFPSAALAWGTTLVFSGGLIFLFSAWDMRILITLIAGLIGFIGLPFTPAAAGWPGLVVVPINLMDIAILFTHAIILSGFIRMILLPRERLENEESWEKLMYGLGLVILVSSQWLIPIILDEPLQVGIWWASIFSLILSAIGFVIFRKTDVWFPGFRNSTRYWVGLINKMVNVVNGLVQFNWMYAGISVVSRFFQKVLQLQVELIEGDGGILWILILSAVVISLLSTG